MTAEERLSMKNDHVLDQSNRSKGKDEKNTENGSVLKQWREMKMNREAP